MSNTISFKHSGNSGDIIYAMAGIKAICEKQGTKADIYIWNNREGWYYEGATHPLGNVMMNDKMYAMLRPLLLCQPYVNSVELFEGQKIIGDLDLIRQDFVNMPYGHIARWYFYRFPDMACDLSKPWLTVPETDPAIGLNWNDVIIVNRTQRYRNAHISYAFLRQYPSVAFAGTDEEYELVRREIPKMWHAQFANFEELAQAIASCKVFIGNQSMCYGIAEAMKVPRIVELCKFAPNVIPEGAGPGYDYYTQNAFEHYVKELAG